jgi:hypothetical protein
MVKRYLAATFALALGLAVSAPAPIHAQANAADGTWTMTMETPQGNMDAQMDLATKDGQLSGVLHSPQGDAPLTGSLSGTALKLTLNVDTPQGAMSIEFTGDVDGDTISNGQANLGDFGTMAWSAKRSKS